MNQKDLISEANKEIGFESFKDLKNSMIKNLSDYAVSFGQQDQESNQELNV
jgi:hypothetical protein